jgi:hypothetical protein
LSLQSFKKFPIRSFLDILLDSHYHAADQKFLNPRDTRQTRLNHCESLHSTFDSLQRIIWLTSCTSTPTSVLDHEPVNQIILRLLSKIESKAQSPDPILLSVSNICSSLWRWFKYGIKR